FDNPRYYNIRWLKMLEEAQGIVSITGDVFGVPAYKKTLYQPTRAVEQVE
ncbi:hypothetical protein GWN42_20340, partial [candidate division KSB1 bacterium]|nr:hypothetical protein [candidate division KSB1 bacterium]NIS23331.1 hypothetical protein [candidate division KSB1 bacterium]NIU23945.1 hypothetical protein [candidate division KSB1 bacterium]NIU94159.1 hypothetical protein [candidate division KSB1 bacterium]NIV95072.1 hypothetical protein [candidate division KSB1 bacterium]